MTAPNKLLILFAHPALEKSLINRSLIHAADGLDHVAVRDLYEIYPDFFIDVAYEQQLLREHDILIFHHPLYWYSGPALLKEWQDLVLEPGFAYGENGDALEGKTLMNVVTTGGKHDTYQHGGINHFTMREILTPYEQAARFCRMLYLPPFVVHGARCQETLNILPQISQEYRTVLKALRDQRWDFQKIQQYENLNQCLEQS